MAERSERFAEASTLADVLETERSEFGWVWMCCVQHWVVMTDEPDSDKCELLFLHIRS